MEFKGGITEKNGNVEVNIGLLDTTKEGDCVLSIHSNHHTKSRVLSLKKEDLLVIERAIREYISSEDIKKEAKGDPIKEIQIANTWDQLEDFLIVYFKMLRKKWSWVSNQRCKYVNLRIDMRDGGCLIHNNNGDRIDPKQLSYQYKAGDHISDNPGSLSLRVIDHMDFHPLRNNTEAGHQCEQCHDKKNGTQFYSTEWSLKAGNSSLFTYCETCVEKDLTSHGIKVKYKQLNNVYRKRRQL